MAASMGSMEEPASSTSGICVSSGVSELFQEKSEKDIKVGNHFLRSNKIRVLESCLNFGMIEAEIN